MKYYIIGAIISFGVLFSSPYLRIYTTEAISVAGTFLGGYLLYSNAYADVDNTPDVISGGVGIESRQYIESVQGDYTVKLVLVGDRGMFLSDVDVIITDKSGNTVVDHKTEGPYLLAKLKPDSYMLSATFHGLIQKKHFTIKSHTMRTIYVRFAFNDASGDTHFNQEQ